MKTCMIALFVAFASLTFGQHDNLSLVTTTGTATVYAEPDEVLIDINLLNRADKLEEARAKNKVVVQRVIQYLKQKGIAAQHIQTQYANLGPVYKDYKSNDILYFEATQTIHVCIKAMKELDEIIDGLLGLNVHRVGKPVFRNTELRKFKDEARRKAVLAAKEKAQLLATTLGQKIGPAHTITELQYSPYEAANAYTALPASPEGDDTTSSFAPGQLEVKASVQVAFGLLEK